MRASCNNSSGGRSEGEEDCQSLQFQKILRSGGRAVVLSLCSLGSITFLVALFGFCLSPSDEPFGREGLSARLETSTSILSAEVEDVETDRLLAGVCCDLRIQALAVDLSNDSDLQSKEPDCAGRMELAIASLEPPRISTCTLLDMRLEQTVWNYLTGPFQPTN